MLIKNDLLNKEVSRTQYVTKQSSIKQFLVTYLWKLIYWCICIVSQTRSWVLGEQWWPSPPSHVRQCYNQHCTSEELEALASQLSTHLMFAKMSWTETKDVQVTEDHNNLAIIRAIIKKDGQRRRHAFKEGAKRLHSYRSPKWRTTPPCPMRLCDQKHHECSHQEAWSDTSKGLETLVQKLKGMVPVEIWFLTLVSECE